MVTPQLNLGHRDIFEPSESTWREGIVMVDVQFLV